MPSATAGSTASYPTSLTLPKPKFSGTVAGAGFSVYVPLKGKIDTAKEIERTRNRREFRTALERLTSDSKEQMTG